MSSLLLFFNHVDTGTGIRVMSDKDEYHQGMHYYQ